MYKQCNKPQSFAIAWPDLSYLSRLTAFLAMIAVLFVDDLPLRCRDGKTNPLVRTADDVRHG